MKVNFNNITEEKSTEEILLNNLALGYLNKEASEYYTDIVFDNKPIDIQVSAHVYINGKKFKLNLEEFLKNVALDIDQMEDKLEKIKGIVDL